MNGQRASVEGKITSMAKTLELCVPEILATAIIPVTHTWRYYCHFVRWASETFLVSSFKCHRVGFSVDSHRSTWLKCEVLIGSSSL